MWTLKRWYQPAVFQGTLREKQYFEGWYLKNVSRDRDHVLAFIPGISLARDRHCFIQVIDGISRLTHYFKFPLSAFAPHPDRFDVCVAQNRFSLEGLTVDLHQDGHWIKGSLKFTAPTLFPSSLFSPGIMGWYTFVPFLECYHGVVSMNHHLSGSIELDGVPMDFDGGKGYIEKDWGISFPASWIWLQCNHFNHPETSFMLSIARIPLLGQAFPGFLSFLKIGTTLHRFATYTRARVTLLYRNGPQLRIHITDRRHELQIRAMQLNVGELTAPTQGHMERRIKESMDSTVDITLKDRHGAILSKITGTRAGLEIMGNMDDLW